MFLTLLLVIIVDKQILNGIIMFGNVSSGLFDLKHLYILEIQNSEISSYDRYAFKRVHSKTNSSLLMSTR